VSRPVWPSPIAVSSIRPLDARVGHRTHRPEQVLFTRQCERCSAVFEYCGGCQPGRLYCGDKCSEIARLQSVRQAHDKYNDRGSEEGLEVHRLEEQERRDRRAQELERESDETRVGDHRCHEEGSELQVPLLAVTPSAAEVLDVAFQRAARAAVVEWVLVAGPELLAQARRRLGAEASCPFCGRRGRIVRVLSLDEWRRRPRRGFG